MRAVDKLVSSGFRLQLTIAGTASGQTALELAREALGAGYCFGDHVELVGPLYGKGKTEALRTSHIFVLPSYAEGFPISALEAMAFGCVVVLGDAPHLRSIFGGFGVRFTQPKSWTALHDVLREIIVDDEKMYQLGWVNWRAATMFTEERYLAGVAAALEDCGRSRVAVG